LHETVEFLAGVVGFWMTVCINMQTIDANQGRVISKNDIAEF
jgi:hypothetical protein